MLISLPSCFYLQGSIGQVNLSSATENLKHLVPEVDIEPTVLEADHASSATLTETSSTPAVDTQLEPGTPTADKPVFTGNTDNVDLTATKLETNPDTEETDEKTAEPEPSKDSVTHDVHFILSSDTDEEVDVDRKAVGTSEGIKTVDLEGDIDIESDLSALAADVLGTKSQVKDSKKSD